MRYILYLRNNMYRAFEDTNLTKRHSCSLTQVMILPLCRVRRETLVKREIKAMLVYLVLRATLE